LFDAGARGDAPATTHESVATPANAITGIRLLGLPVFAWLMIGPDAYLAAFVVLAVVGSTDWLDGYVARRFDQVSRLGTLLDPLIDRLLLATVGVTLVVVGFIPWWVVALILIRDILVLGAIGLFFSGNPPYAVSRTGKTATACLLVGVPAFLVASLDWSGAAAFNWVAWLFTSVGIAAYYVAAVSYARIMVRARRQPEGG
jgi:cardiolipin synthase